MVIPCFNEGDNVLTLINRINEIFIPLDEYEVILVDNGSTDGSFEDVSFECDRLFVHKINKNIGYGNGIKQGLKVSTGDFIGWTHADFQTDIKDFIIASELVTKDSFVKGRRVERKLGDKVFSFGMGIFESLLFQTSLYEINAQPNILPKSFFEKLESIPSDFSFDLYMYYMAKLNSLKIKRFDVKFPDRVHGHSKWNTTWSSRFKFIKRTILYSFKLRFGEKR